MGIGLDEAKDTEKQQLWILDDGEKQQQITGIQGE